MGLTCSSDSKVFNPSLVALVPPELEDFWREHAEKEFKGIPTSHKFYLRALDGLMTYFRCCGMSEAVCLLPSKAVDSVWHAWLDYNEKQLNTFCGDNFGKSINHIPVAELAGDTEPALARTYVNHCKVYNVEPCKVCIICICTLINSSKQVRPFF
jgi:hypothetical protein